MKFSTIDHDDVLSSISSLLPLPFFFRGVTYTSSEKEQCFLFDVVFFSAGGVENFIGSNDFSRQVFFVSNRRVRAVLTRSTDFYNGVPIF